MYVCICVRGGFSNSSVFPVGPVLQIRKNTEKLREDVTRERDAKSAALVDLEKARDDLAKTVRQLAKIKRCEAGV